jgi:hypothetical protein
MIEYLARHQHARIVVHYYGQATCEIYLPDCRIVAIIATPGPMILLLYRRFPKTPTLTAFRHSASLVDKLTLSQDVS